MDRVRIVNLSIRRRSFPSRVLNSRRVPLQSSKPALYFVQWDGNRIGCLSCNMRHERLASRLRMPLDANTGGCKTCNAAGENRSLFGHGCEQSDCWDRQSSHGRRTHNEIAGQDLCIYRNIGDNSHVMYTRVHGTCFGRGAREGSLKGVPRLLSGASIIHSLHKVFFHSFYIL